MVEDLPSAQHCGCDVRAVLRHDLRVRTQRFDAELPDGLSSSLDGTDGRGDLSAGIRRLRGTVRFAGAFGRTGTQDRGYSVLRRDGCDAAGFHSGGPESADVVCAAVYGVAV